MSLSVNDVIVKKKTHKFTINTKINKQHKATITPSSNLIDLTSKATGHSVNIQKSVLFNILAKSYWKSKNF